MKIQKLAAGIASLLALLATAAMAAGTDELWEITTRMEMPGMPMAMPGQTQQVCKPKGQGQNDPLAPNKNDNCKMVDMQHRGNTSTFKMECSGKNPMKGEGEMTHLGDSYNGKMHMTGKMEGEDVDMTQTFSGKKIGTCTYEDLGKKASAQSQAMTADLCNQSIEELSPYPFDGKTMGNTCDSFKPKFCARVKDVEKTMHTPAGYEAARSKYSTIDQSFAVCGIDANTLLAELCPQAAKTEDWTFLAAHCPAETKIAAQEHCAGRDYTAAMSGPYAPLCRAYAQQMTPAERATEAARQSATEAVTEGVKSSLKKLLPF